MAKPTSRSRIKRMAFVGLVLLLLALCVAIRFHDKLAVSAVHVSPDRVPRLARNACTIVPGVHLLGGLSPSAAYVLETTEGLVLIDSGLDADAEPLKSEMATLELDWRKIVAILLTHCHGDHCGGAEGLRAAVGARVYAGAGDVPVLEAGKPSEAFFSTFYMPNHSPHSTTVDVSLHGNERLSFGNTLVQVIETPGHTPGSICYLVDSRKVSGCFSRATSS